MDSDLTSLISEYPEASEETIKRIFIRNAADESYRQGTLKERSDSLLQEIALLGTIGEMKTDDEIRDHLANLERCRAWLTCHIYGIRKGQEKKLVPVLKAKHESEELVKKIRKSTKDNNVAMLVQALLSKNSNQTDSRRAESEKPQTAIPKLSKQVCDKCKAEVFSLKFHKC